jgi:KDO2-lipid IV(A) lauroyltransferase
MKKLRYALEGAIVKSYYHLFGKLPLSVASGLTGWVAKTLGPHIGIHKRALTNLRLAFPQNTGAENQAILKKMWEHWGRTIGEYTQGAKLSSPAYKSLIRPSNPKALEQLLALKKPCIFVTGHYGNFQIITTLLKYQLGLPVAQFSRSANAPGVRTIMLKAQRDFGAEVIEKSPLSYRELCAHLEAGTSLVILFDQRSQKGPLVPFFGRPVRMAEGIARLAKRFDAPIVPVFVTRKFPHHFEVHVKGPLAPTSDLLPNLNHHLEDVIRSDPAHWFWIHDRWGGS